MVERSSENPPSTRIALLDLFFFFPPIIWTVFLRLVQSESNYVSKYQRRKNSGAILLQVASVFFSLLESSFSQPIIWEWTKEISEQQNKGFISGVTKQRTQWWFCPDLWPIWHIYENRSSWNIWEAGAAPLVTTAIALLMPANHIVCRASTSAPRRSRGSLRKKEGWRSKPLF